MHGSNPCADGIPNVKYFAGRLSISPNYFGDLVKRETGRTAQAPSRLSPWNVADRWLTA